jgi:hypothetical protein
VFFSAFILLIFREFQGEIAKSAPVDGKSEEVNG